MTVLAQLPRVFRIKCASYQAQACLDVIELKGTSGKSQKTIFIVIIIIIFSLCIVEKRFKRTRLYVIDGYRCLLREQTGIRIHHMVLCTGDIFSLWENFSTGFPILSNTLPLSSCTISASVGAFPFYRPQIRPEQSPASTFIRFPEMCSYLLVKHEEQLALSMVISGFAS